MPLGKHIIFSGAKFKPPKCLFHIYLFSFASCKMICAMNFVLFKYNDKTQKTRGNIFVKNSCRACMYEPIIGFSILLKLQHTKVHTGFVRVMENLESNGIYHFNFQAWKVMEFKRRHGKFLIWKSNMHLENKKAKREKKLKNNRPVCSFSRIMT